MDFKFFGKYLPPRLFSAQLTLLSLITGLPRPACWCVAPDMTLKRRKKVNCTLIIPWSFGCGGYLSLVALSFRLGYLDGETIKMMNARRCANRDVEQLTNAFGLFRQKRFATAGAWDKRQLSWSVREFPPRDSATTLTDAQILQVIREAFRVCAQKWRLSKKQQTNSLIDWLIDWLIDSIAHKIQKPLENCKVWLLINSQNY